MVCAYKLLCQLCFVSIGLRSLDSQDDAIGNDRKEDGVFKRRPLDEEFGQAAYDVALTEDKEGGGTLLLLLQTPFAPHFSQLNSCYRLASIFCRGKRNQA